MAGASAAVGDDGAGALHHGFPVGVSHVGNEHIARLHFVHLADVGDQAHGAGADFLADGAAFGQYRAVAFEFVALLGLAFRLAFNRFGPRLQDVELVVGAVFPPFDVHGAAIVLLNHQRILRQLLDVGISQGVAVALLNRHVHSFDQLAGSGFFFGGGKHHLDEFAAQIAADDGFFAGLQHGFVHVKLIGVYSALHHGFAQAVTAGDEDHVAEAAFCIHGKHHARCALVGAHHALHAGRQGNIGMGKALVHAVADGAVVIQRGEYFLDFVQHLLDAHHVQEGFLLAGKRGIRQVFRRGGRTHGKAGLIIACAQRGKGVANGFFQIGRERLRLDHAADFSAGCGQGVDVFNIQSGQLGLDFVVQPVVLEKFAKRVRRRGKASGHPHALRQLRDHLAQAGVFATYGIHIAHAEFFKRHNQIGRLKQCSHSMLQR